MARVLLPKEQVGDPPLGYNAFMRSSMDMLRITLPALVLALGLACSATDGVRSDETGLPGDTDTDPDLDTDDDGTPELSDVEWFTIEGHLQLNNGDAIVPQSLIEVVFHPSEAESLNDTGAAGEPCKVAPTIDSLTASDPSEDDVTLYGWWSTALEDPADDACITQLPANLHLGIGPVDPGLFPAMDDNGYDPYSGLYYGLYVQYGSDAPPIWAFGITGTEANFAGTEPAGGPPLPDGSYELVSLHLLPFDAP